MREIGATDAKYLDWLVGRKTLDPCLRRAVEHACEKCGQKIETALRLKNWKRLTRSELALISSSLKSGWTYSPAPGHALSVTWGHPIKRSGGFRPIDMVFRHIWGRPPWLPGEDLHQLDFCPKTSELRESLRFLWREHDATLSSHEIAALAAAGVPEDQL